MRTCGRSRESSLDDSRRRARQAIAALMAVTTLWALGIAQVGGDGDGIPPKNPAQREGRSERAAAKRHTPSPPHGPFEFGP